MRIQALLVIGAVTVAFSPLAKCEETLIVKLDLTSLGFEIPPAIQLRADMAALQRAEFIESNKDAGFAALAGDDYRTNPSAWVGVFRAWDGLIFLTDHLHMALWIRDASGWRCVVSGVRVDKTMGGAPARLPVRYLGDGLFAVAETLPGDVAGKSKDGFPQARAATFLVDSKDGKVKERSDAYVYDHNPPISIPRDWANRYKIKSNDSSNH